MKKLLKISKNHSLEVAIGLVFALILIVGTRPQL